ncbi:MAG: translin family protein [Candidatus Bathyarchaeia archaeon]
MLKSDLVAIKNELKELDEAREKIIKIARIVIKLSSNSIAQIHRAEFKKASKIILKAEKWVKKLNELLNNNPMLNNGNSQTAFQEYVEAKLLYSIATNKKLIPYKDLKVNSISYILGLLDLIGELKRMILDLLRKENIKDAESLLGLMEKIYEDLASLDHTYFIQTFRRKLDVARKLIEMTRGDVISNARKISLEKAINELKSFIEKKT